MLLILICMSVAALATALTIPILSWVAVSLRLLDYPDTGRRAHARPMPRLGGVAVLLGFVAAILLTATGDWAGAATFRMSQEVTAIAIGGGILFIIGLLDDLKDISPATKLVGQTAAALIVCGAGFRIETLSLPLDLSISLGWLSWPISILWIVGVSNAFNLIDGIDGLAGGIGVIALLVAAASGAMLGSANVPFYALVLAGALLAFLRFNFPPARVFLGDSGTLVIGFLLAVLTVKGATRADGSIYPLVPLFALSYPLLDTGIAMIRRWLRGVPLSRADDRHIHHQLRTLGLNPRRAVSVIYLGAFGAAILGLWTAFAPPVLAALAALAGVPLLVITFVAAARLLEYHELMEVGAVIASGVRQARGMVRDGIHARELARRILASKTIDEVAALLANAAPTFRFAHVRLTVLGADLPPEIELGMEHGRLWQLERIIPLSSRHAEFSHSLTLRIWSYTGSGRKPAGAERIASILAPAITGWLGVHGQGSGAAAIFDVRSGRPILSPVVPQEAIRAVRDPRRAASTH